MTERLDVGLELWDKGPDGNEKLIHQLTKRFDVRDPRFVERYREGNIQVLVQFAAHGCPEEHVASFEMGPHDLRPDDKRWRIARNVFQEIGMDSSQGFEKTLPHLDSRGREPACKQESVLISVIQQTEPMESVASTSLVRFGPVDLVYGSWLRQGCYYTSSRKISVIRGVAPRNGELNGPELVFPNGCQPSRPTSAKSERKMIEGGPEVLDHLSCNERVFDGDDRITDQAVAALLGIWVVLMPDQVIVLLRKGFGETVKLREALVGPINFGIGSGKGGWWHDLPDGNRCA